jgi:hypothetical protein
LPKIKDKEKEVEDKKTAASTDKTRKTLLKKEVVVWNPDLTDLETRKVRVTINSSSMLIL